MGSNIYSIHAINSSILRVSVSLGMCQSINKYQFEVDKKMSEIKNYSNDVGKIIKLITSIETKTVTFYIVDNNGIISAVSEYFDFLTIKDEIKKWFWNFDKYLLVVSCFDSDFLDLSLFKDGDYLTSYITRGARSYNLTPSKFDTEIISEIFHVTPKEIEQAYSDNSDEALDNFEKLFNLPLKLKVLDLIDSSDPNVKKVSFFL
jgi:hypothetical protein